MKHNILLEKKVVKYLEKIYFRLVDRAAFAMKIQEVKPEGRRTIGFFYVRAAHNGQKVDVCACSLLY